MSQQGLGAAIRRWRGGIATRSAQARGAALVGLLLSGALSLATDTAFAQTSPDELAREHFESGRAYFAEAEYGDALRAFQKAYDLSGRPAILLDLSIVHERMLDLRAAITALDRYLEVAPDEANVPTIRKRRDNLQHRLEEQVQAEAAAPQAQESVPVPPPAEKSTVVQPVAQQLDWQSPQFIALGVGALAGLAAIGTGIAAKVEYGHLNDTCHNACSADRISSVKGMALSSTILTGVSLVGLGVGAWLWFQPLSDKTTGVAFMPLPSGAAAQARFTF